VSLDPRLNAFGAVVGECATPLFKTYTVAVKDPAVFDELTRWAGRCDAALNLLHIDAHPGFIGVQRVTFECTADHEDLVSMLQDFASEKSNSSVINQTLQVALPPTVTD
jgi:hypothetical protein